MCYSIYFSFFVFVLHILSNTLMVKLLQLLDLTIEENYHMVSDFVGAATNLVRLSFYLGNFSRKFESVLHSRFLQKLHGFESCSSPLSIQLLWMEVKYCWCICNFGMYSSMYLMYCDPMFILGCFYYVFESCCHAPMFRSGGLIM